MFKEIINYGNPTLYTGLNSVTSQYNGNISQVEWQVAGREAQAYTFDYDDLDRLTNARYTDIHSAGWASRGWSSGSETNNNYNETPTYDVRGNILSLNRNGMSANTVITSNGKTLLAGLFSPIDNLTYTYGDSNRLKKVTDGSNWANKGFIYSNSGNVRDYEYDKNGNLTADRNKGITNITYNYLNLPMVITFTGNRIITFVYDASGAKLRKITSDNGTVTTYDYVNGVEYKNNILQRIAHTEGSVSVQTDGSYQHEFVLRDHLGNTRVTFSDVDNNGTVVVSDVQQINSYYPFGLNMDGNFNGAAGKNKYAYNGKEWNDDFGLGLNDYGRRFYDPAIGRFDVIDRFVEKYSTQNAYQYAGNNPIKNIDINGDSILVTHRSGFLGLGKKETLVYNNGHLSNRDGSSYSGKVRGFLKNTVSDLNKISNGGAAGNSLVGFFNNSKNNVTISSGSGGNSNTGKRVSFDTNSTSGGLDVTGNTSRPTFVGLAHELVHTMENTLVKTDLSTWFSIPNPNDPTKPTNVPKAEISTSNYENRIRAENNIPLRAYYTSSAYPGAELLNGTTTAKYPSNDVPTASLPVLSPQPVTSNN